MVRRRGAAAAALAWLLAGCDSSSTVNNDDPIVPTTTLRVSLSSLDEEANRHCEGGLMAGDATTVSGLLSGDGTAVTFHSKSAPFHPEATVTTGGLYVKNLVTRELYLASRAAGESGAVSPTGGVPAGLSRDGRRLAFLTFSPLDPAHLSGSVRHVYVRDLDTHQTSLASRATGASGAGVSGNCDGAVFSADGLHVAFHTTATNISGADTEAGSDVYVRDLATDVTELISRASGSGGAKANAPSIVEAISEDGSRIVFQSTATNLGSPGGQSQLYVRHRGASPTTSLVSRAAGAAGAVGDGPSFTAAITADGLQVAFSSVASNLHPEDVDTRTDIYVRDLATDGLELVSRMSGAAGPKGLGGVSLQGHTVRISREGRFVAFESRASNLVPNDTNGAIDIFIRDRSALITDRVSVRTFGSQFVAFSWLAGLSDDGSAVMFYSGGTDIVDGDTNGATDMFVRSPLRWP